jgi:hypothetical protein
VVEGSDIEREAAFGLVATILAGIRFNRAAVP